MQLRAETNTSNNVSINIAGNRSKSISQNSENGNDSGLQRIPSLQDIVEAARSKKEPEPALHSVIHLQSDNEVKVTKK